MYGNKYKTTKVYQLHLQKNPTTYRGIFWKLYFMHKEEGYRYKIFFV
jgi:hypothetical protein